MFFQLNSGVPVRYLYVNLYNIENSIFHFSCYSCLALASSNSVSPYCVIKQNGSLAVLRILSWSGLTVLNYFAVFFLCFPFDLLVSN